MLPVALMHIHQVISEKFRDIDEVIALPMTPRQQKTAEKKINLRNLDWKKVEQKVSPQTAVGPGGIPMQLINLLGPESKAYKTRKYRRTGYRVE